MIKYSDAEFINILKKWYSEHKEYPTFRKFSKTPNYPAPSLYVDRFKKKWSEIVIDILGKDVTLRNCALCSKSYYFIQNHRIYCSIVCANQYRDSNRSRLHPRNKS